MPTRHRYCCRSCGALLDAWRPWAQAPTGARRLAPVLEMATSWWSSRVVALSDIPDKATKPLISLRFSA